MYDNYRIICRKSIGFTKFHERRYYVLFFPFCVMNQKLLGILVSYLGMTQCLHTFIYPSTSIPWEFQLSLSQPLLENLKLTKTINSYSNNHTISTQIDKTHSTHEVRKDAGRRSSQPLPQHHPHGTRVPPRLRPNEPTPIQLDPSPIARKSFYLPLSHPIHVHSNPPSSYKITAPGVTYMLTCPHRSNKVASHPHISTHATPKARTTSIPPQSRRHRRTQTIPQTRSTSIMENGQ